MSTAVVQIPVSTWSRIERLLDRLDKEQKSKPKSEWISVQAFAKRTGKTKEQVRYMRQETHPELFRGKANSNQYEVDYAAYLALYNA